MLLFADKPLPEPEGDAPDWTYEELIDTFVVDYSLDWIERKRKPIERGLISPHCRQLIVELRSTPPESMPIQLNIWTFAKLSAHRCWLLSMDGLEEIEVAEYQELIADTEFTRVEFSTMKFCFENEYRSMVTEYFQKPWAWVITRYWIARNGDGKPDIANSAPLAFS